jgi:hypothetical protein
MSFSRSIRHDPSSIIATRCQLACWWQVPANHSPGAEAPDSLRLYYHFYISTMMEILEHTSSSLTRKITNEGLSRRLEHRWLSIVSIIVIHHYQISPEGSSSPCHVRMETYSSSNPWTLNQMTIYDHNEFWASNEGLLRDRPQLCSFQSCSFNARPSLFATIDSPCSC